jgi:hypothetical protein
MNTATVIHCKAEEVSSLSLRGDVTTSAYGSFDCPDLNGSAGVFNDDQECFEALAALLVNGTVDDEIALPAHRFRANALSDEWVIVRGPLPVLHIL